MFHESLPDNLTKEEALKKTLDHLLKAYEQPENETDIGKKADQKDISINNWKKSRELSAMPVVTLADALDENRPHLDSARNHLRATMEEINVQNTLPDEATEENIGSNEIVIENDNNIKGIAQPLSASMNKPGMFTCPICYRTMPTYFVAPLLKCDHTFCDKCYVVYLKEQIDNNKVYHSLFF